MTSVSERENPLARAHQYSVIICAPEERAVGGPFMEGCPLLEGKERMGTPLWLC